jgi:hypothetical protein
VSHAHAHLCASHAHAHLCALAPSHEFSCPFLFGSPLPILCVRQCNTRAALACRPVQIWRAAIHRHRVYLRSAAPPSRYSAVACSRLSSIWRTDATWGGVRVCNAPGPSLCDSLRIVTTPSRTPHSVCRSRLLCLGRRIHLICAPCGRICELCLALHDAAP